MEVKNLLKPENRPYIPLVGLGLVNYALECWRDQPAGDKAWQVLLGSAAVYEALAPQNELLSESADRWIEKHPVIVPAVIGYTALHIMNRLPSKIDIFHQATRVLR